MIPGPWPEFPWFYSVQRGQKAVDDFASSSPVEEVEIAVSAGGYARGTMRIGFTGAGYGDARTGEVDYGETLGMPGHFTFTVANCGVPGLMWPEDYAFASWQWAMTKLNDGLVVPEVGWVPTTVVGTVYWRNHFDPPGELRSVPETYPDKEPPQVRLLGAVEDQPPESATVE